MKRGRFIAVEGGDGAGKGGVISALSKALEGAEQPYIVTREPGGTSEGEKLRSLLVDTDGPAWDARAELLLVMAARIQHIDAVILPQMASGATVLCDRFVGSTLAYQGAGHGLPADLILDLHRNLAGDLWPDLTILLDVDSGTGLQRSRARLAGDNRPEGRFEELDLSFHERVRQSFLKQAQDNPARFAVIDAHQAAEGVQAQAVEALQTFIGADAASH